MRIGWLLLFMFLAGAGLVVASAASGEAWPLFLIWPAYAVAPVLASRGADDQPDSAPQPDQV